MLVDEVQIVARSGAGGNGMVHFHREKYVPRGGPDGGDGGRGGDVVLQVRPGLSTLYALRHARRYTADDGRGGGPNNMSGKAAVPLIIEVPPGTSVYDAASGEQLGDLTAADDSLIVCKGGRGGRGNQHFATSRNQAPRTAEKGEPGQERKLRLELKLIADIGIIGVPNAGKSTLLASLTNARPKIASYPFTTLEPQLGVARVDDEAAVVLADIPGLIEGASQGAGLGHDFLRHIQRTRVLIHLLDGQSVDPLADYSQINSELALFDPRLAEKPQIVALNKIDDPLVKARLPEFEAAMRTQGIHLLPVSAMARTGTSDLLKRAAALLAEAPPPVLQEASVPVYRPAEDPRDFRVQQESEHIWRLSGTAIERAAAMTYWEHEGSVRRFQKLMESI
ncbi:MAG TPA: GTPase ObgE, partial [Anaerolineales bacterium]|nr:GTPase ObgE [Anaerolineales bacterium]